MIGGIAKRVHILTGCLKNGFSKVVRVGPRFEMDFSGFIRGLCGSEYGWTVGRRDCEAGLKKFELEIGTSECWWGSHSDWDLKNRN